MSRSALKAPQLPRMILILSWLREERTFTSDDVVDNYSKLMEIVGVGGA